MRFSDYIKTLNFWIDAMALGLVIGACWGILATGYGITAPAEIAEYCTADYCLKPGQTIEELGL